MLSLTRAQRSTWMLLAKTLKRSALSRPLTAALRRAAIRLTGPPLMRVSRSHSTVRPRNTKLRLAGLALLMMPSSSVTGSRSSDSATTVCASCAASAVRPRPATRHAVPAASPVGQVQRAEQAARCTCRVTDWARASKPGAGPVRVKGSGAPLSSHSRLSHSLLSGSQRRTPGYGRVRRRHRILAICGVNLTSFL